MFEAFCAPIVRSPVPCRNRKGGAAAAPPAASFTGRAASGSSAAGAKMSFTEAAVSGLNDSGAASATVAAMSRWERPCGASQRGSIDSMAAL